MKKNIAAQVASIVKTYDPSSPGGAAGKLRKLWLQFEPRKTVGIKAEQRKLQETTGTPMPVLRSMGEELGKAALERVDDFIPLVRSLWEEYGREGRVVATIPLGAMELSAPKTIIPILKELCRTCHTWQDVDSFAMNALEPVVREDPKKWIGAVEPWLADENKWVRRAGVIVLGRLPMKHPKSTALCLEMIGRLLFDEDADVKKGTSFAVRLAARGEVRPVRDFLARHVPPKNPAATWVLCDAIKSMTKKFLPEFASLLPRYEKWAADPALEPKNRRSVESAVDCLQSALG